jgi:hypothetical protein
MTYCSNLVNLQALYAGDRSALPHGELAHATARLATLETQLERITNTLLTSDVAPVTFLRRA